MMLYLYIVALIVYCTFGESAYQNKTMTIENTIMKTWLLHRL